MEKTKAFWRTKVIVPTTANRSLAIYRDMWVLEPDTLIIAKAIYKAQVYGWTVDKTQEVTLEKKLTSTDETMFLD
jgi:hypothetical protein